MANTAAGLVAAAAILHIVRIWSADKLHFERVVACIEIIFVVAALVPCVVLATRWGH